eukprot:1139593-Pelagomonas_calceolata.AAC.1
MRKWNSAGACARGPRAVDAYSNSLYAILNLTATISVSTCPPVRDFEHEEGKKNYAGSENTPHIN